MQQNLSKTVVSWLRYTGFNLSSAFFSNQLESHPDYPSIASITDTMDALGIPNAALVVDKEKIQELPLPFLAHMEHPEGGCVLITDPAKQLTTDNWSGIVIVAEKPEHWQHKENSEALVQEQKSKKLLLLMVSAGILFAFLSLINNFSFISVFLLTFSLAGLFVAVLIVQQEMGINNHLANQLCGVNKTDCNAVIHSKGSRAGKFLNWADAGIIYFSSYLMLLVTSINNSGSGINVLPVLSALVLPFTIFSVYYQWRVIKKWCVFCLLVITVLYVQFFLLLPVMNANIFKNIGFKELVFAAFIFSLFTAIWLLVVKPVLKNSREIDKVNLALMRFKKRPDVFQSLLQRQKKVDYTPFEDDLQLGNPEAPIQILVACNPYCGPCATAHKILHDLVEKNDIGITIRFSLKITNLEDKRTEAISYLLQLVKDQTTYYKRKALYDWYKYMDLEKFKNIYPLKTSIDIYKKLKEQQDWSEKTQIKFTPTIFINGFEMPVQYRAKELIYLVSRLDKFENSSQKLLIK
jgi:protein-disulfide isomerase